MLPRRHLRRRQVRPQPPAGAHQLRRRLRQYAHRHDELRADAAKALSLIPGKHRFNLHAFYGEFGGKKVDRDEIEPAHFRNWIAWAKAHQLGLDFNPTCFSHPKAADGFTLSHRDPGIRRFWIEHCQRSREIGAAMGRALGTPCVTNVWIPDGFKDTPADRVAPRERLAASLDAVFRTEMATGTRTRVAQGVRSDGFTLAPDEFARIAEEEGFPAVAKSFKEIAKVEAYHERRYRKLLENVNGYKVFKKDLKRAAKEMPNFKEGQPTGETCDKCGKGEMVEKAGKFDKTVICGKAEHQTGRLGRAGYPGNRRWPFRRS